MALTDQCVAYWKLDESSGNAFDSSPSGFTLTNTNTVSYGAGLINNGADFTSTNTNKQLTIANNCGINGGAITISVWINKYFDPSTRQFVFCGSSVSQVMYYMEYLVGTGQLRIHRRRAPNTDVSITSVLSITDSIWHHVVLTYDGVTLAGYLDNVAITGASASGNGTSGLVSQTSLGAASQLGNFSRSKIDEVGIWSRVLSISEVNDLWNGGAGIQLNFIPPVSTACPAFLLMMM